MKNALCKIGIVLLTICMVFSISIEKGYAKSSDANLKSIEVSCGVLDPEFSAQETKYTLYVPSDLTHIIITPTPENESAKANKIDLTLTTDQEPEISVNCTFGSDKKEYTIQIKRINKTTGEIEKEIAQNGYAVYKTKTKFYQNKDFLVCFGAALAGVLIIALLYLIFKKRLINTYDEDEKPFYSSN